MGPLQESGRIHCNANLSHSIIRAPGHNQKAPSTSTTGSSAADSLEFEDDDDDEWVAPELFTPQQEYGAAAPALDPALGESQATVRREASDSSQHPTADPEKRRKKSRKQASSNAQPLEQFPFPATAGDEEEYVKSPGKRVPQMRTAKARDGGRTQSGGVRGVPADDLDDF